MRYGLNLSELMTELSKQMRLVDADFIACRNQNYLYFSVFEDDKKVNSQLASSLHPQNMIVK